MRSDFQIKVENSANQIDKLLQSIDQNNDEFKREVYSLDK
jgi:hypothetical protein